MELITNPYTIKSGYMVDYHGTAQKTTVYQDYKDKKIPTSHIEETGGSAVRDQIIGTTKCKITQLPLWKLLTSYVIYSSYETGGEVSTTRH